jgi:hypothetical protein
MRRGAAASFFLLPLVLSGFGLPGLRAQTCGGTERWQVKVGADSGSDAVRLEPVVETTLQDAIRLSQPHLPPQSDNDTRLPEETHVYRLSGHLVEFKQEAGSKGDSDYHLVITDDSLQFTNDADHHGPGHSLIAEIPDPDCIPGAHGDPDVPSRFIDEISCVRAKLDAKFPDANKNGKFFDTGDTPVTITGVGFFDRAHGQTGRARNNLEIHPLLDLDFGDGQPSCLQAAGSPAQPAATPPSPPPSEELEAQPSLTAGPRWEHKSIAASTPEALSAQANALSAQGWELVGVAFDPRNDTYVGFLKRPVRR